MAYYVEYYEKNDGSRPAEEFILSLDFKMQAKVFMMLEFLEAKGLLCGSLIPNILMMASLKSVQSRGLISQECYISSWWENASY